MTMQRKITNGSGEIKPHITLIAEDYDRLVQLARVAAAKMPELAEALEEELQRADVIDEPADRFVRMGSQVEFKDDGTGQRQSVTLVYPSDADFSQGRISVLTPIGTALIGLSQGDSITWRTRGGELRQLTVLAVRNDNSEPAGGESAAAAAQSKGGR